MNKKSIALLLIFFLVVIGIAIVFDQTWGDNDCNENCDDYQCSVPTKIILVRHGQTSWNVLGILQGNADVPLDSTGVIEAHELAVSTSVKTVDAVYSSPLSRAYETAQAIAAEHQLSVEVEDDLREIGAGIYTGYQGGQIPSDIRISWTTDANFTMPSGVPDSTNLLDPSFVQGIYFEGESLNMVADRTWDEITDIAEEHCGENVVTVTHGGIIGITLTQVYGHPVTEYRNFTVETGSQTVLEIQPDSSVVVLDDW
jgi:broad specificity phosphatase PhoE